MSDRCKSSPPRRVMAAVRQNVAATARLVSVTLALMAAQSTQAGAIPAAPSGVSYFFATREACHASGVFSRQDCAMAFANASAQLRDRAPKYGSAVECRLRFALCEPRPDRSGFSPVGIGVEIVVTPQGARGAPAMAVEAPGNLFPPAPITQEYAARDTLMGEEDAHLDRDKSSILPSDRFEPLSKRPQITAQFSFNTSRVDTDGARPPPETPEQRRARLRAAPFIR